MGEKRAVRREGLVRYTLKLVILLSFLALISTLLSTFIRKAASKYSKYFLSISLLMPLYLDIFS